MRVLTGGDRLKSMPHLRTRYLVQLLNTALRASPIVGISGQRQTGKTTLAEANCQEFVSLDDEEQLELSLKAPKAFLNGRSSPFGIDECQLCPRIFPALKEKVRVERQQGQFLLTGSVRFTSVSEITESLTGRILDLELLPLTLSEAHGYPLTDVTRLAELRDPLNYLRNQPFASSKNLPQIAEHILKGGLPGICFLRNNTIQIQKMRTHLKTILDRDLRLVTKTDLDYLSLKTFIEELALQQGENLDLARAARGAKISPNTARKVLSGLESIFLIRQIPRLGTTMARTVFFEDQGMATFLLRERGILLHSKNLQIRDLYRGAFQQIFAQLRYRVDLQSNLYSYLKRGGAMIELVAQVNQNWIGYSIGNHENATATQIKSAESFLDAYPTGRVFLLHLGSSFRKISDQIFEVPFGAVL